MSPTRDSAKGQNVQYEDLFQSLKEYVDQSLAKQNELNESRMQTLLLNFSELKETQKVVINKLDTLIDILDPRRSHTDEQKQTFDTDNANHYVSPHHGLITEVQETSNLEQSIDKAILMSIRDPGRETYITPGTIVYDGQENIERGDEVTSVMVRGRELRVRKRAPALESPYTQFVKKIRHAKSEVPKFDPFKKVKVDQLQAFQTWFEGDANGNTTIKCGLAFQKK